jgi:hypothetical protein
MMRKTARRQTGLWLLARIGLAVGSAGSVAFAQPEEPRAGEARARLVHVRVQERSRRPLVVVIDGVECGPTPWEGELEAGTHVIEARGLALVAAPTSVAIGPGEDQEIELVAVLQQGVLVASLVGGEGTIAVDGRVVGRTPYRGLLPAGPHTLRISETGFDTFEKTIFVTPGGETRERVTLGPASTEAGASEGGEGRSGVFGGIMANLLFEPGGTHSDVCATPGITNCSSSDPVGGGIIAHLGYAAGPTGIDALAGLALDASSVRATAEGVSAQLTVPRAGGIFAVRGRVAWDAGPWQNPAALRLVLSGGLGAALREVAFIALGVDSKSYLAPAVTVEGAAHVRFSPTLALSFGLLVWAENAGNSVLVQAAPLPAPRHIVSGTQIFVSPTVGIELGP